MNITEILTIHFLVDRGQIFIGALLKLKYGMRFISSLAFIFQQARISLTEKKINLDYREIVASNGIIHVIDGVFIPPSIVPILPHRCDKNESQILEVGCVGCGL